MATFELSQKIKGTKTLSNEQIIEFIKQGLEKSCKFTIVNELSDSIEIKGRVKETLFTPVTKFKAVFTIKVDGDKARISVDGSSGPNWIFAVFFIIGLFTGIFLIIGIGLFLVQMKKPKEMLDSTLRAIDTEFGEI